MKPYPSYKDSGVPARRSHGAGGEWIGEIPSHWEVKRLKYMSNVQFSSVDRHLHDDEMTVKICHYPDVYYNEKITSNTELNIGSCSEQEYEKYKLKKGNVIITKDSESPDDIGVPTYVEENLDDTVCGYHLSIISTIGDELLGGFLFRFIQSHKTGRYFEVHSNGITRFGIGKHIIENLYVPFSSLSEQHQIVEYLDEQTQKIDELIDKTEKKIELLKFSIPCFYFYKIDETKIKHLEDYWFQRKPSSWKILKLREIFEVVSDRNHPDERLLSVHQLKGVIYRDEQEQDVMNPSGDISNYKLVKPGDFIISLRSSEGCFEFSDVQGLVSPVYTVLRPKFKIDSIFYKYLFKTENFIVELNRYIKGIRDGKNINFSDVRDIPIPVPITHNQDVSNKHRQTYECFDYLNKRIELLKEYRQSLISEVVTGKIDVRDWKN